MIHQDSSHASVLAKRARMIHLAKGDWLVTLRNAQDLPGADQAMPAQQNHVPNGFI